MKNLRQHWLHIGILLLAGVAAASGQEQTVTARVALINNQSHAKMHDNANVVMWLAPVDGVNPAAMSAFEAQHLQLVQKNKSFSPHVLIVPVGGLVAFPNRDPVFHNVFSLFEGKRFDLGLYEAGTTRDVRFDKPGISYIFCNIHPEMSAVVIAIDTPYYGVSDRRGEVVIPRVPPGKYMLHIWHEAAVPETLKSLTREVEITSGTSTLGVVELAAATLPQPHKNKYGRAYDAPNPAQNPAYPQP